MTKNNSLQLFTSQLEKAKNLLVLLPTNPNFDAVASGLAFYLLFKKHGKSIQIGCPTPMKVDFNRLVGIDKIRTQVGSRNLIISLDYPKEAIEKVSYNDDNNKFNLVIEPKEEFPPFAKEKINFSYSGVVADLILVIGAGQLEDLGHLFKKEKKAFEKATVVNIANTQQKAPFGKINLVFPQASSCAEIVCQIIKENSFQVDQDIATNLMAGLEQGTNNFTVKVSAETFEIAAWLLSN